MAHQSRGDRDAVQREAIVSLPTATVVVAMSRTNGACRSAGAARLRGLVPIIRFQAKVGDHGHERRVGDREADHPPVDALPTAISMASAEAGWPSPFWPSTSAVAPSSRATVGSAQGCTKPARVHSTYFGSMPMPCESTRAGRYGP